MCIFNLSKTRYILEFTVLKHNVRESHGFSFSVIGVHIEEEEQEEAVDTSLRGRLLRLVQKVKSLRKKPEAEPEPEEDKKPSKRYCFSLHIRLHCPILFSIP